MAGASSDPEPPEARDPRHVDVVGDSLTRQATAEIEHQLSLAGYTATVASEPGRDLRSPFVAGRLDALADNRGDVLVLATAANDAVTLAHAAEAGDVAGAEAGFRAALDDIGRRFADRCVVVVNGKEDVPALYRPAEVAALNRLLAEASATLPNMVVADWAAASRTIPPDQFIEDGLHFGPDPTSGAEVRASAAAYAVTVVAAVDSCAQRLRALAEAAHEAVPGPERQPSPEVPPTAASPRSVGGPTIG